MSEQDDTTATTDVRHEGTSFEPVPRDASVPDTPMAEYPPEADPGKAGDLPAAEVPGEQADPARRLTGGDQPGEGPQGTTEGEQVTPGSVEPPD